MKFLEVIAIFGTGFILSIIGVMVFKKCSVKNATIICRDFTKDILGGLFEPAPPPIIYYPTIVGWDGTRIIPELVDSEFEAVCRNFACCFCTKFSLTNDLVMYQFDIIRSPNSYDDKVLSGIIQKQAEKVVTKTMRIYDCYLPPEPISLIELFDTRLCVAFARTEAGIKILDDRKHKIQKRKVMSNRNFH